MDGFAGMGGRELTPHAPGAPAEHTTVQASRDAIERDLLRALASDDAPPAIARSILHEILQLLEADAAAIWMTPDRTSGLELVASVVGPAAAVPRRTIDVPPHFAGAAEVGAWCIARGWTGVPLSELEGAGAEVPSRPDIGFVAVMRRAQEGREVRDGRFLRVIRGELAIALRAAQLRETLQNQRAELAAILDGASDAIIAVDAARRVVRLNRAASQLLERRSVPRGATCDEVLGCRQTAGENAVRADDASVGARGEAPPARLLCGVTCPFGEVLGSGVPVANREHEVCNRSGARIPVLASYARTPGPRPGAVAILRDLRSARAVDELTSSFVAAVSHELRTPVALISGYVQTLLGLDPDPTTARRYVERIGRAAQRLGELVNQILDIAHLEGDPLTLHREPTAVSTLFGRLAQEMAESPGMASLGMAAPPDLPRVDVDPARIGQVLANLVSNAVKYAGPGGPQITIRAAQAGDQVVVRVEDEGPGIDAEDRAHVFERFYRGRRVRESSSPGSGLGLYICRRLVEAHGGRIWLDERVRGTTVCFSLPVAVETTDRREAAVAS